MHCYEKSNLMGTPWCARKYREGLASRIPTQVGICLLSIHVLQDCRWGMSQQCLPPRPGVSNSQGQC